MSKFPIFGGTVVPILKIEVAWRLVERETDPDPDRQDLDADSDPAK